MGRQSQGKYPSETILLLCFTAVSREQVTLAGSSATVLKVSVHATRSAPVLLGAAGTVSVGPGGELRVADLAGEPGSTRTLEVLLPPGTPCPSVKSLPEDIGPAHARRRCTGGGGDGAPARVALGRVTFSGAPFPHAMQIQLACATRAVHFHPNGGQSDSVWLPARTPLGGASYVW